MMLQQQQQRLSVLIRQLVVDRPRRRTTTTEPTLPPFSSSEHGAPSLLVGSGRAASRVCCCCSCCYRDSTLALPEQPLLDRRGRCCGSSVLLPRSAERRPESIAPVPARREGNSNNNEVRSNDIVVACAAVGHEDAPCCTVGCEVR